MTKKATIANWKEQLGTNAAWALRGLMRIYEMQTPQEQEVELTVYHNGVGFSGVDADILTSFVKQYQRKGSLSEKQMNILFQRMPRYAGQLYKLTYGTNRKEVAA